MLVRLVTFAITVVLLYSAWRVYQDNHALRNKLEDAKHEELQLLSGVSHAVVIHGLLLPISTYTKPIQSSSNFRDQRHTLVLFYQAHCHACDAQMPYWEAALSRSHARDLRVLLVAVDTANQKTDRLVSALHQSGLPFQVSRVANHFGFEISTGLTATPTTLLTKENGNDEIVECVNLGVATPERLSFILARISSTNIGSTTEVFPASAQTHIVEP